MNMSAILTPRAIAAQYTEVASNRIPFLGEGLFPAAKKLGLDLSEIKGYKGLNVSLKPANFDAKAPLRGRLGFEKIDRQMAFFREAMLVSERNQQEIMRVQDMNDPYVMEVLRKVFDDVNTLVDAANIVPERMRMQLLFPANDGYKPGIALAADGVSYSYDYDPNGEYAENNVMGASANWSDPAATPLTDIAALQNHIEGNTGNRPVYALMNRATFNLMKETDQVKKAVLAQNATANIFMSEGVVREILKMSNGITPIVYDKVYKDEDGVAQKFVPDGMVSLLPEGALGKTWYGTTPEERGVPGTQIVHTGVAVTVVNHVNPVNTETIVSEIVLPSFERMNETGLLVLGGK